MNPNGLGPYSTSWLMTHAHGPYHTSKGLELSILPLRGVGRISFEKHFMPLSTTQTARDALKAIRQGSRSVAEYMSKFDQYTSQTGWSADDHRQHFYDGLLDRIKDTLPLTAMAVATFDELRSAAQTLDQRMRQR